MAAISSALAGLHAADQQLSSAALQLSAASVGSANAAGIDTVDLSALMVNLIQARNGAAVSAKIAHTVQDMDKSTINLLG
jgi:hypothetical protein